MKVLIKLNDENKIDTSNFGYVISSNDNDVNKDLNKWSYIPQNYRIPYILNSAFWIINNKIDNNKFNDAVDEIIIDFSTSINFKEPTDSSKKEGEDVAWDDELKQMIIKNIDLIRIPFSDRYYQIDEFRYDFYLKEYILIWITILNDVFGKLKTNIPIKSISEIADLENKDLTNYSESKIKDFRKFSSGHYEKIRDRALEHKLNYVNSGNEGFIIKKENDLIKTINKSIENVNEELRISKKFTTETKSIAFDEEFMIEINKDINLVKLDTTNDTLSYKYLNKIIPKFGFNYAELAHLLKIQYNSKKNIILDIKTENFGKMQIDDSPFYKLKYSDFGKSFIKLTDENEWKNHFIGNVRDYFLFVKYRRNSDYRYIIRETREKLTKEEEFGGKLRSFYESIVNKKAAIYLCHDEIPEDISEIKKLISNKEVRICGDNKSTMSFEKELVDGKVLVYSYENDKVTNCNCEKGFDIANKLGLKGRIETLDLNNELVKDVKTWIIK